RDERFEFEISPIHAIYEKSRSGKLDDLLWDQHRSDLAGGMLLVFTPLVCASTFRAAPVARCTNENAFESPSSSGIGVRVRGWQSKKPAPRAGPLRRKERELDSASLTPLARLATGRAPPFDQPAAPLPLRSP